MLQFNLVNLMTLATKRLIYSCLSVFACLFLIEAYFSQQYKISEDEQAKFQSYLNKYTQMTNKFGFNSVENFKWTTSLENLVYVISSKLHIHKLIMKPNIIFLHGYTQNTQIFNRFWLSLRLDKRIKNMELLRWGNRALNSWSYVIQIEIK